MLDWLESIGGNIGPRIFGITINGYLLFDFAIIIKFLSALFLKFDLLNQ